jgi:hypothetical protein
MQTLNLYLVDRINRPIANGYDAFVVAAESEAIARQTHPGGSLRWIPEAQQWDDYDHRAWTTDLESLEVVLVGVAGIGVLPGVVLSSFNAG